MISAEQIYSKAQSLDTLRLQELADFLNFLLSKMQKSGKPANIFPETQLEAVNTPSVYQGKPLALEDMNQILEWEANQKS